MRSGGRSVVEISGLASLSQSALQKFSSSYSTIAFTSPHDDSQSSFCERQGVPRPTTCPSSPTAGSFSRPASLLAIGEQRGRRRSASASAAARCCSAASSCGAVPASTARRRRPASASSSWRPRRRRATTSSASRAATRPSRWPRRHQRLPVELPVTWQVPGVLQDKTGILLDIGRGGAFVQTEEPLPADIDVVLKVSPAGRGDRDAALRARRWRGHAGRRERLRRRVEGPRRRRQPPHQGARPPHRGHGRARPLR